MEAAHTRRYLQALLVPSPRLPTQTIGTIPRGGGGGGTKSASSSTTSGRAAGRSSIDDGDTSSAASTSDVSSSDAEELGSGDAADDDASRNTEASAIITTPNATDTTKYTTTSNNEVNKDDIESSSSETSASNSSVPPSSASSSSGSARIRSINHVDVEARIRKIMDLLSNDDLLEEDKPERLKDILPEMTAGTESSNLDVDAIVLAILHRYREDVAPTGQIFNSPTPLPRPTGSLSRSSSFRRNLTPTSAGSLALKRSGMATPTRPISPSPLRPHSPSLHGPRMIDPFAHLGDASFTSRRGPGSSAPSSPFGSPRMLNAGASEFRPNPTSAEFKPGPPSLSVRMPEIKTRSPIGTPLSEASPTLWAFQNSPLGTPKFASGSVAATAGTAGSYFGNVAPRPSTPSTNIPSDPWNTISIPSTASFSSNPGISHSTSTASSESGQDEISSFDPFGNSIQQVQQVSVGKSQILSSEDEDEWGIPSTSYEDAARRTASKPFEDADSPRWNLYDDDEDDEDLAMLSFQGGKLVADDLTLVEPPNKQRPVFDEHYQPQSTSQYSQLPQDQPGWTGSAAPDMQSAPGASGLGASSSNYIMTPFDVLYSIFAGADIQAAELEEALSKSGWDVDKAMEWIISNPRLPGGPHPADGQVDQLNMLGNMDFNDRSAFPGGAMPSPRLKGQLGSGSRPLVISRDSFQRSLGAMGRPASPRWASGPTTPGGRSDRSGDGYFGAISSGGPALPSTRLCKYYLQGNCLRSDCRFSHDLSKAVCKFWLRGHCLKGEGRCEFLHSVPPHLAQDVAALRANAMRSRDQEKTRWNGRSGEDDDGQGRAEDDFPSLAAATASARDASMAGALDLGGKDPATSRWAGIVKNGRPVAQLPVNSRPSLPRAPSSSARLAGRGGSAPFSQPRPSSRLALRPPTLLPTLTTGAAVSRMYESYRQQFLEYGNARNKCLVKAAACFRAGDGAGAKRWSREAQDWNKQVAVEGMSAAENIVSERRSLLKEAVLAGSRQGLVDGTADRQYRGQECGNGLGICLGVAAAGEALGPEGSRLSAAERTEVALDLHGLHPSEGVDILERFLLGLANEGVMRGLAFIVVGQEKHTGTADPQRGSKRFRLIDAVGQWLDSYGYAFWLVQGILAIDPYL